MKQLLSLSLLLIITSSLQAQNYTWAVGDGGNIWDDVKAMHMGADNNLVVTGMFSTTATFDTITLTSMAYQDVFVAKYTVQGTVLWAKAIRGTDQEWGYDITTDPNNNVYVTGYFQSPVLYFTPTDNLVRSNPSTRNIFVAKYNSSGVFQWARLGHGGTTNMFGTGYSVTCDNLGNVIIAGNYNQQLTIGGTTLAATNGTNIFMAKFDSAGNLIWAKAGQSNSICWITDMTTDGSNNIYVTGKISTAILFGTTTVTSNGGDDAITGKFDSNGNLLWMMKEGKSQIASTTANNFDCGNSIALDAAGNVFVGGSQLDTTYWDTQTSSVITLQSAFVVKYNNSGSRQWIKYYGSDEKDVINGISLDINGDPYVHGTYRGAINVGGVTLPSLTSTGAFIAKLNRSNGNTVFAYRHGVSVSNVEGMAIAVDKTDGDIYTAGNFQGMCTFGSINIISSGTWDIFVTGIDNPVIPSGINESSFDHWMLYPNPAVEKIFIRSSNSFSNRIITYSIFNVNGTLVKRSLLDEPGISVNDLPAGVYVLELADEVSVWRSRFIRLEE